MKTNPYLSITPEIEEAIRNNRPVVALESTILSHGMPYPENVEFSHKVEEIVRSEGAIPATTAIIGGKLKIGLTAEELELMCKADGIGKVSRRDVSVYLSSKKTGATTVATTMLIASMAGIRIFATGGIGGVHRGAEKSFDISADLEELAGTEVAVICAGAKSILDIGLTLEYLETAGVPVIGYGTDDFPAFYARSSGYPVDYNASDAAEVAAILKTQWGLGLKSGIVVANPIPKEFELDTSDMEQAIETAVSMAEMDGITGKNLTPYLLAQLKEITSGQSFASNLELAYNNARVASRIAIEYCKPGLPQADL